MIHQLKLLLRDIVRSVKIKSIRIQNFKSLRDVEITFPTPLTITVGPNGSGKTALVEAISLLREILDYLRGRKSNPFGKWWGFRNVVWRSNIEIPIVITITVELSNLLNKLDTIKKALEKQGTYEMKSWMIVTLKEILYKITTLKYSIIISSVGEEISVKESLGLEDIDLKIFLARNKMEIHDNKGNRVEIKASRFIYSIIDEYDKFLRMINVPIGNAFEIIYDEFLDAIPQELRNTCKDCDPRFLASVLSWATIIFGVLIDGIICIKEIDLKSIRSPQVLMRYDYLSYDAGNLIPILYRVGRGRIPNSIRRALRVLLNYENVDAFFELTSEGTVFLKLSLDDIELSPPSIPSGVWKVLAIETALLLRPTILLIDEFENSLHARMQEFLLDEIRQEKTLSIITTHSPVPLDYARSLDEILLLENIRGETRASRLKDLESYREKLRKLGLTPSEALLYGFIEGG